MIKIGNYNTLEVARDVDFGFYLTDGGNTEILLPVKYAPEGLKKGDSLEVFIYNDSEDRLIATTEHPFATVGEFAFLQVNATTRFGAFLDWGLAKDILVPFREQKVKMKEGGVYPVFIYLDDATKRVVASAKIEKFIGNKFPEYAHGTKVEILPYNHNEIGYKAIVDNLFHGMLYSNELYTPIIIGQKTTAWVNRIREDGKIDLLAVPPQKDRVANLADTILNRLRTSDNELPLNDSTSPEMIKESFGCSKKDFKKAIGQLYKMHLIDLTDDGIRLITQ